MLKTLISNLDAMPGIARDTVIFYGRFENVYVSPIAIPSDKQDKQEEPFPATLHIETKANGILHEYAYHFDLTDGSIVALLQGTKTASVLYAGRIVVNYDIPQNTGIAIFLICDLDTENEVTQLTTYAQALTVDPILN